MDWKTKRRLRKSGEYAKYYQEYWAEHPDLQWLPKWDRETKKAEVVIYSCLAFLGLFVIGAGATMGDAKAVQFGVFAIAMIAFLAAVMCAVRRASHLHAADEYALKKTEALDETGTETETEE